MATNVKVVGTDLRQVTIKVTPGTHLTEIRDQACAKLKVDPGKFSLKHKQRKLDLSQPFRTTGLIAGAKLELVVQANTPTVINVALQLPPGSPEARQYPPSGRVIEKFPSDFTVWQILRQFESGRPSAGKNLNITARGVPQTANGAGSGGGQLYYEVPNVAFESRAPLATFVDFQKTLSQLGYSSGGVLMRLSFQKTDKTLADALTEVAQYFEEDVKENTRPQPAEAALSDKPIDTADTQASPESAAETTSAARTEGSSISTSPTAQADEDAMDVDGPPAAGGRSRPCTVYASPSADTPLAATRAEPDAVYEPDIAQLKAQQRRLELAGRNRRLLSDQELAARAAEEARRLAAVRSVRVRVRLPDATSVEWPFGPADTGADLYAAVRAVMAEPALPFRLLALPGRQPIRDESENDNGGPNGPGNGPASTGASASASTSSRLIEGHGLRGDTLVTFVWDDRVPADVRQRPILKGSVASRQAEEGRRWWGLEEAQMAEARQEVTRLEVGGRGVRGWQP
ncbi:GLUT4 regulating protein TUG-domain-containing protein [Xylariaceae sp. FL0804]|nr:GLUT4 regulating protein TUG-domain-containing protein [Xylariaceae sp. FL0804]